MNTARQQNLAVNVRTDAATPSSGDEVFISGYKFVVDRVQSREPNTVSRGWDVVRFVGRDVHTSRVIL